MKGSSSFGFFVGDSSSSSSKSRFVLDVAFFRIGFIDFASSFFGCRT